MYIFKVIKYWTHIISIYLSIYLSFCLLNFLPVSICLPTYLSLYVSLYPPIYINLLYIAEYIYIHIYIYTYIYIYIYTYIYIYIHGFMRNYMSLNDNDFDHFEEVHRFGGCCVPDQDKGVERNSYHFTLPQKNSCTIWVCQKLQWINKSWFPLAPLIHHHVSPRPQFFGFENAPVQDPCPRHCWIQPLGRARHISARLWSYPQVLIICYPQGWRIKHPGLTLYFNPWRFRFKDEHHITSC